MKLNKLHIAILLLLCGAAASCNRAEQPVTEPQTKSPIELSVGGVESDAGATKAVITDGVGKTLRAFTGTTRLFFAIVAEDGSGNKKYGFNYGTAAAVSEPAVDSKSSITFPNNYLYWDDAYARDSKVSVYSIAVANKVRGKVELTDNGSIAIGTESPGKAIIPFSTTDPGSPTFKWQIGVTDGGLAFKQDQTIFDWADLIFSNNIADNSTRGGSDNRLKFHTDPGDEGMYHKFDKGELIYYHALTQFTIKIKCGDGFVGNGDDFKFTTSTGVPCSNPDPDNSFALNGFYGASGVFYIGNGEFAAMTDANLRNYTSIYKVSETHQKETAGAYYVLKAYVFPGTDMTGSKDNAFSFIIDGNQYDVSMATLYNALQTGRTNDTPNVISEILKESKYLKAGYNYEFTLTVGKSKIKNITAQVADWETVTADNVTPSNARIKLKLEERGSALTDSDRFALYRAADNIPDASPINDNHEVYNWKTGYNTTGETPSYVAPVSPNPAHWTTSWYWDSNKHFYHFRALAKDNGSAKVAVTPVSTDSGDGDFYALASAVSYNDILWGAPMLDDADNETAGSFKWHYGPEKNGFDAKDDGTVAAGLPVGTQHQIYKAIGPTEDAVKLTLFHMMSDLTINITTTIGAEKVDLGNGTTSKPQVFLEDSYANGKVLLGNGLVKTTDPVSDQEIPQNSFTAEVASPATPAKAVYKFGVVPQNLATSVNDGKGVQLRIVTPDKNEYIVDLKNVKATTVGQNNIANPYTQGSDSKYAIDRWYPGYKYTYNFTLKKSQIDKIEVTIVGWETLETDNEDVTIQ